jgi:two-component system chemotaxis response regulator CheV
MSKGVREILLLESGGRYFGFDVAEVLRVVQTVRSVPLPHSCPAIQGVINLHGNAVPVLDVCAWIGGTPKVVDIGDILVILNVAGRCAAVRADRARGVARVADADVEPVENLTTQSVYFTAVALIADEIVLLPELSNFLAGLTDGHALTRESVAA